MRPQVCSVLVWSVSRSLQHSWHHTGVAYLSHQAYGKVVFEEIPVIGVGLIPPTLPWHDSSLYLFVLVLFLEVVVLSKYTYSLQHFLSAHGSRLLGVLSTTITFVLAMFILRPICLLSPDSSCSMML